MKQVSVVNIEDLNIDSFKSEDLRITYPDLFLQAILMGDWMAEAREEREEPAIPAWLLPKDALDFHLIYAKF